MKRRTLIVDLSKTLYVTRPNTIAGKKYESDEVFDTDSVNEHDLKNLVHWRYVTDRAPNNAITKHETPKPIAPPTAPNKATIKPVGGGYYEIVKNGVVIDKVQGKEKAQKVLDEL